jgi:hypothetical protein
MYASLLAALLFLAPSVQDFDGLKLEVPAPPQPPAVQGNVKSWEGVLTNVVSGQETQVAVYNVGITDLKALSPKPTEDQLLQFHERKARTGQTVVAQNFRTTYGKIGTHKLLVLSGSALAPSGGGQPANSFWVSCAFMAGDKAYEFSQVSLKEGDYLQCLRRIATMTLVEDGKPVQVTGTPLAGSGEYTITGIPFVLTAPATPYVSTAAPADPAFGPQYTAVISTRLSEPAHTYLVRKLTGEEKRTDTQLFRDLVTQTVPEVELPESKFVVKDGSGTLKVSFERAGKQYEGLVRFEREGAWVAVLVSAGLKPKSGGITGAEVRRVKAAAG